MEMSIEILSQRNLHATIVDNMDTQPMYARENLVILMLLLNLRVIITIAIMVITNMNVDPSLISHLSSMSSAYIVILAIIMDTSHKIVDLKRIITSWQEIKIIHSIEIIKYG